jgi:DMSO/TMAO reductase YedYZ molybdopterin-dependent catalytic subunit
LLPSASLLAGAMSGDSEPQNLSYPLRAIEGTTTPQSLFFVRDHFKEPELSLDTWQLRIEGRVERPYEVSFSDLVELPGSKVEAVLECAGNVAGGSAASNGIWEGVPISALLAPARPASDAAFLMLEGADSGRLLEDSPSRPYAQLVPMKKCMEEFSLIAFKLNDLTLPKRNGFPARALFPGWYGMDSVKWLRRIVVLGPGDRDTPFHQSGMNRVYNRLTRTNSNVSSTRLSSIQVKSAVAWPSDQLKIPAGRHLVWGFAWSGTGAIRGVTFSVDAGRNWRAATVESEPRRYGWLRWSYRWDAKPGDYVLMSRAADQGGNEQPIQRDPARKDAYELNWCVPLRCSVR